MKTVLHFVRLLAVIAAFAMAAHATSVNPFTDLGGAGPHYWGILAMGGDSCNSHSGCGIGPPNTTNVTLGANSQVDGGNIGVAPKGNITGTASTAYVHGNLFLDNAGVVSGSGTLNGTLYQDSVAGGTYDTLLDNAVRSALVAYTDASGMAATVSVTGNAINNPGSAITVTGVSGMNVLNLTTLVMNNASHGLTISAPSDAQFVINVTGNFSLTNAVDINLTGGISQYNVLYNVQGTGSAVSFSGSSSTNESVVSGIVLAPYRDINLNFATVNGELMSGNLNIALNNYSKVDVPEPATLLALASGLAALVGRRRLRRS